MRRPAFLLLVLPLFLVACTTTSQTAGLEPDRSHWQVLAETPRGTAIGWDGVNYYVLPKGGKPERLPASAQVEPGCHSAAHLSDCIQESNLLIAPYRFTYGANLKGAISASAKLEALILSPQTVQRLGFSADEHSATPDDPSMTYWGGPSIDRYVQLLTMTPTSASRSLSAILYIWRYKDEDAARAYYNSLSPQFPSGGTVGPYPAHGLYIRDETIVLWQDGSHIVKIAGDRVALTPALVEAVFQAVTGAQSGQ